MREEFGTMPDKSPSRQRVCLPVPLIILLTERHEEMFHTKSRGIKKFKGR
jgi:hypothetical protein